jgi:hypothetical protein
VIGPGAEGDGNADVNGGQIKKYRFNSLPVKAVALGGSGRAAIFFSARNSAVARRVMAEPSQSR